MYKLYTQLFVELIFTPCFNLEDSFDLAAALVQGLVGGFHF